MSEVKVVKVDGEETRRELEWFYQVLSGCYGPWGGESIGQSSDGAGALTLTKSSSKLLQGAIRTNNPLTKNIVSHMLSHAHCYGDATLYAGMLSCSLILCGLKLQNISRRKAAMGISHTLSLVVEWLRSDGCPVKQEIDFGSVEQLIGLLVSFLGSKLSWLSQHELHHLSTLLLKAFLRALPSEGKGVLNLCERVCLLSASPTSLPHPQSQSFHEGLLLSPEMCSSAVDWDSLQDPVLTVVFDTSLSGDIPQGSEVRLVGVSGVSVDDVVLEGLMAMGRVLVERGVGLLACQKCIHPNLRDYLNEKGVVVLERLSSLFLGPVHQLCGGDLLSSTSPQLVRQSNLGRVSHLTRILLQGQWYVQLRGVAANHSTVFLSCGSERHLEQLRSLCHDALVVLEWCVGNPLVLCGGGCTDTNIAHHLREQAKECDSKSANGLQQRKVIEMVAACFLQQACALDKHGALVLTDAFSHHCWFFPPPPAAVGCDGAGGVGVLASKATCNCGAVSLSDIPDATKWSSVNAGGGQMLDVSPPQLLHHFPSHDREKLTVLFDLMTPKVAALTCGVELCENVLTTAFVLSQQPIN